MRTTSWFSNLSSGVEVVDEQHNRIIELIKYFNVRIKKAEVDALDLMVFLVALKYSMEDHFDTEEKLLVERHYPQTEHHKKQHKILHEDLTKALDKLRELPGEADTISKIVEHVVVIWQGHLITEDMPALSYYKTERESIPKDIVGQECEVFDENNNIVVHGEVISVTEKRIEIRHLAKDIQIEPGVYLKVSLKAKQDKFTCFTAELIECQQLCLVLGDGKVLKSFNDRANPRVTTDIDAIMWTPSYSKKFEIRILDISTGGMLIESNIWLAGIDEVIVDFPFNGHKFAKHCRVVRELKGGTGGNFQYGVRFIKVKPIDQTRLKEGVEVEQNKQKRGLIKQ